MSGEDERVEKVRLALDRLRWAERYSNRQPNLGRAWEANDVADQALAALDSLAAAVAGLEQRADDAEKALREIAEQQPVVLAYIESNGFVFDSIGREPGNWQHLAFSIYTDLCEVDTLARTALAAAVVSTEPTEETA